MAGVVPDSVWADLPSPAPRLPSAGGNAPDEALRRAHAHAARLPASVEGFGGDAALWHAARELAALGLSEPDVVAVLSETYSPRCTPPWDAHAIGWKAQRAVAEHQAAFSGARGKLADVRRLAAVVLPEELQAAADAMLATSADADYAPATAGETDDGVTWGTIEAQPPPRNYRVDEFEWGAGRPLGLLAGYNASKTLTSKQIIVDYALGRPILGKYQIGARGTGRVLDLCYEQFTKAAWTYTRLARAAGASFEELNALVKFGRPSWYLSDGMTRPLNPELREYTEDRLVALCEGFDICNVDPYGAAALGIDESSSAMQEPARMLERVSEATGCAFMICVHRGRDQEAEHARGHSSIDDAFDTTILISKHDEKAPNARLFKCLKRPMYGFEPEVLLIEDVNEDGTAWTRSGTRDESWGVQVVTGGAAPRIATANAEEKHAAQVVAFLATQKHHWLSRSAIGERLGLNTPNVRAALSAAERDGLIQVQASAKRKDAYVYTWKDPAPTAAAPTEALDRAAGRSRFAGVKT